MLRLGVNIDHVATLRQVRRANEPDPVHAALAAECRQGPVDQVMRPSGEADQKVVGCAVGIQRQGF